MLRKFGALPAALAIAIVSTHAMARVDTITCQRTI